MPERTWAGGLSPAQADGQACVICGRTFRVRGSVAVPVGRSSSTGSQVFACARGCADDAAELAQGHVVVPVEALTAAGAAFLAALEAAGGDPHRAWPDDLVAAIVHAAAPLVAAGELRRLAELFARRADEGPHLADRGAARRTTLRDCRDAARARADQLDPPGGAK
jgi:hypothetical protein